MRPAIQPPRGRRGGSGRCSGIRRSAAATRRAGRWTGRRSSVAAGTRQPKGQLACGRARAVAPNRRCRPRNRGRRPPAGSSPPRAPLHGRRGPRPWVRPQLQQARRRTRSRRAGPGRVHARFPRPAPLPTARAAPAPAQAAGWQRGHPGMLAVPHGPVKCASCPAMYAAAWRTRQQAHISPSARWWWSKKPSGAGSGPPKILRKRCWRAAAAVRAGRWPQRPAPGASD